MKYLLPCSCGESIFLDIAQAGQVVTCSCGESQQAPTLLKMKGLQTIESGLPSDSAASYSVDLRFFFLFLGVIVLIPSLVLLIWAVKATSPKPADVLEKQVWFVYGSNKVAQDSTPLPEYERYILSMQPEYIDYMTPFEVFMYFRTLKSGPMLSYNFQENYGALKDAYLIRVSAGAIGVGLGLLSIVASLLLPKRTRVVGVRKGADWK